MARGLPRDFKQESAWEDVQEKQENWRSSGKGEGKRKNSSHNVV